MARPPVPPFLRDLGTDPQAFRTLLVAAVAMAASGINPPVASPALPNVQALIRAQPEITTVIVILTLASAGLLFLGGILGDADGRRGLLLGALAVLAAANLFGLVVTEGPPFVVSRIAAGGAAYAVLPFALAMVATAYRGVVRATAIGVVYAAYGGATAVSPVLLTVLGPTGPRWPAFVVAFVLAALALRYAWSRAPDLPGAAVEDRGYVIATAVWAFAIVILSAGVVGLGDRLPMPFRIGLLVVGLTMVAGYLVWDRRTRQRSRARVLHVDRRPVTVAVAVGVIVGFAQAAPLYQLPLFFRLILGYGPIVATIATAPFVLALVVAGPVAGALIARYGPRSLIAAGLALVGLGNVLVGAVLGEHTAYPAVVPPLILIGAGFVVATTVRTAIIFASVSRGLPATAAALNEASVLVGSRIGLAVLTSVITQRALDIYGGSISGLDPARQTSLMGSFRDLLAAIGMPGVDQVLGTVSPTDLSAFASAAVEAYQQSLIGTGVLALVAAPIAWIALGPRDPLATVWDHREERTETAAPAAGTVKSHESGR